MITKLLKRRLHNPDSALLNLLLYHFRTVKGDLLGLTPPEALQHIGSDLIDGLVLGEELLTREVPILIPLAQVTSIKALGVVHPPLHDLVNLELSEPLDPLPHLPDSVLRLF